MTRLSDEIGEVGECVKGMVLALREKVRSLEARLKKANEEADWLRVENRVVQNALDLAEPARGEMGNRVRTLREEADWLRSERDGLQKALSLTNAALQKERDAARKVSEWGKIGELALGLIDRLSAEYDDIKGQHDDLLLNEDLPKCCGSAPDPDRLDETVALRCARCGEGTDYHNTLSRAARQWRALSLKRCCCGRQPRVGTWRMNQGVSIACPGCSNRAWGENPKAAREEWDRAMTRLEEREEAEVECECCAKRAAKGATE